MQQAEAWFREVIKDRITIMYQAKGGYLDGTMTAGDTEAKTVKFPIIGRLEAYPLTGAIQDVRAGNADMKTVRVMLEDFEASAWINSQDKYKMGPSEQDGVAKLLTMAIKRRGDKIKLDAMKKFKEGKADIDSSKFIIDILRIEEARASIAAKGQIEEDDIFCPIPEILYSQLLMYKEFSNAKYVGPENTPFSQSMRKTARTMRGVHIFTMPDENFFNVKNPDPEMVDIFMWSKGAMGAETPWNKEAPSFSEHPEKEGTPLLGKAGIGGAALGIIKEGVVKMSFKFQRTLERPAVLTKQAA